MKNLIIFALIILCQLHAVSQNLYRWDEEKISVESNLELSNKNSSSGLFLEGIGIRLEITKLGGMEGISGLEGSLNSYASSYNYTSKGNVQTVNDLKNLNGAIIEAKKDGKSVILCMFATKDFKNHYTCEIVFSENQRNTAKSIIKSLAYGIQSSNVSEYTTNIVDQPNVNNVNEIQTGSLEKGSLAPGFTLKNANGNTISLSLLKGKILLLDFWGTWCKPCIQMIPKLKELYAKYGNSNFEIISIANDTEIEKWKNMVSAKGMTWTNVIDLDESVTKLYSIKAFPTLILIDEKGKIIEYGISEPSVEEFLNNSDKEKPIIEPNTTINTHKTGTEVEKKTWDLLSRYSPEGYKILDDYYRAPDSYQGLSVSGDSDFTKWIDGTSENDIIKSVNTVVHEMCHGYTSKLYLKGLQDAGLPLDNAGYSAFYLGNDEMKVVKHTKVYFTKEINGIFPEALKTSRYETYVYPSDPMMGSQQYGIYGLLDELNAYYHGTKTSLDFYAYYKENQDNAEGWSQFFSDFYGTYYAYLEFKGYMIFYMMHAEKNHKNIYSDILNNQDFLYAFRKTDENYSKLITDFKNIKSEIFQHLKKQGKKASDAKNFTYIDGKGTGNFSDEYQLFQNELKDTKYQKIAQALGLSSAFGPELGF